MKGLDQLHAGSKESSHQLNEKFSQDTNSIDMKFGGLDIFFGGLEKLIGPPQFKEDENKQPSLEIMQQIIKPN